MKKIIATLMTAILIIGMLSTYGFVFAADEEIEWADFSEATFGVQEDVFLGYKRFNYVIENIKQMGETKRNFIFQITDSTEKPSTDNIQDGKWKFNQTIEDGKIIIPNSEIEQYLELNKDFYLWVYEYKSQNLGNIFNEAVTAKKIEKVNVPSTPETFNNTGISYDGSLISINAPIGRTTVRKMNVKIGKITDNTILNNIKNNKTSAFTDLLAYSKNSDAIFSKTLETDGESFTYKDGELYSKEIAVDLFSTIENDKYYYLYVDVDDENGKYNPIEAVTFAKASKYDEDKKWYLFFYGNQDFNWDGLTNKGLSDEELDPENYIILPSTIWYSGADNKTTSKISVSSKLSNYSLYYQYLVMDEATYTKFNAQYEELKKDAEKLTELKNDYQNKQKKDSTSDETKTAMEAYNKALEEYKTKLKALKNLVPKYNDSAWVETKDGSLGNLTFLNNYSKDDKVAFVLWAKLKVGEDTYYDFDIYTMNGTKLTNSQTSLKVDPDEDGTTAPTILPYAGINAIAIITIVGATIIGIVAYKKYRGLKEIK